jgi:hypothetical protein
VELFGEVGINVGTPRATSAIAAAVASVTVSGDRGPAALLLGAHLLVDTGVPGTYAWGVRVLGAQGSLFARDQPPTRMLQLAKAGETKRRRMDR